ncbi:MAG: hypothetical protein IPJ50_15440 [Betaproteobacteria bacterium]|nr:hypothetical protein [Betaproteobacteria bacterium]
MSILERRLAKIEAQLQTSSKLMDIRLLGEPSFDATPEQWEKHRLDLIEAEATSDLVILLSPMKPYRQRERPCSAKIKYVDTKEEGQMLALSLQPSELGNKNRLDDVIQGLSGNVLGIVEKPLSQNW